MEILDRIYKTLIQAGGAEVAYLFGTNVTGKITAAGVTGAPETAGGSLGLIPVAIGLDTAAAWAISECQERIYEWLDIK